MINKIMTGISFNMGGKKQKQETGEKGHAGEKKNETKIKTKQNSTHKK